MAGAFADVPEGRAFVRDWIKPTLERQMTDTDADVRYFASRALQKTLPNDS